MNDDQFTKLFEYIETFFDDTNKRFDQTATKDSVDNLTTSIDIFIAKNK